MFREHFFRIYRFFRSKAGAEAEDLTQRTFLALMEKRDDIRPGSSFAAYAFGVARKQLLMHFRKVGSDRETDFQTQSIAGLGRSPETDRNNGEELRLVLRSMQALPVDFQMALELYYWEEMPVADIAVALDISPGTVKSRLWRGRDQLRKEIEAASATDAVRESTVRALNGWLAALKNEFSPGEE